MALQIIQKYKPNVEARDVVDRIMETTEEYRTRNIVDEIRKLGDENKIIIKGLKEEIIGPKAILKTHSIIRKKDWYNTIIFTNTLFYNNE